SVEIAPHAGTDHPQLVTGMFDKARRVESHLKADPGLPIVEPVEGHHASVVDSRRRLPGDSLVRVLFGDLCFELTLDACDVDGPVESPIIKLLDLFNTLHEPWELLELGPLVVGG